MNNKEKSYYANITKHLNSVYKSVELDIDSICSILEHVGNDGKQRYTTNYAILPIEYWIKGKNAAFSVKKANGVSELENHFATFVNAKKNPFLMNGYILNLVTCFDNRGFTKHYNAKIVILFQIPKNEI